MVCSKRSPVSRNEKPDSSKRSLISRNEKPVSGNEKPASSKNKGECFAEY